MNNFETDKIVDLNVYFRQLQSDEIVFAYKGPVSLELFDAIVALTEQKLNSISFQGKIRRRIHVIAVEILQNIFHHFGLIDNSIKSLSAALNTIIYLMAKNDDGFYLIAGNYVPDQDVASLKKRIDNVNELSPEELINQYRAILSNGTFSEKGGAGLGIIDIARKSGQRLEYEFVNREMGYTFFCLKVKIPV